MDLADVGCEGRAAARPNFVDDAEGLELILVGIFGNSKLLWTR